MLVSTSELSRLDEEVRELSLNDEVVPETTRVDLTSALLYAPDLTDLAMAVNGPALSLLDGWKLDAVLEFTVEVFQSFEVS
jgi:hypothetical protein